MEIQEKRERPQSQPEWEREEQVLLVVEYFLCGNKTDELNASNRFISELLRRRGKQLGKHVGEKYRNVRGIQAQRENLSHFDPLSDKIITGHESKWMREIIKEYVANPELIRMEAYKMIKRYSI